VQSEESTTDEPSFSTLDNGDELSWKCSVLPVKVKMKNQSTGNVVLAASLYLFGAKWLKIRPVRSQEILKNRWK